MQCPCVLNWMTNVYNRSSKRAKPMKSKSPQQFGWGRGKKKKTQNRKQNPSAVQVYRLLGLKRGKKSLQGWMRDYGKAGQKRGAGRRLGDWNNRVVGCKADSAFRSSVPTQEKGDRTGISDLLRKTTFLVCDSRVSSRFQQQIHNFNKFTRRSYKNKKQSHIGNRKNMKCTIF